MNRVLIIISVALIAISAIFEVNYLDYAKPIEHSAHNKISLKDFRGFKRINQNLHGGNEFAYIVTEIKSCDNEYPFDVKAVFHPSRSYVFNENTIGDKNLLAHEMYHFHITEYIARKLRREIIKNKNEDIDIDALLQKYREEENLLQKQYDKETYHSYFSGKQIEWQQKIDSLLNTLNKYS